METLAALPSLKRTYSETSSSSLLHQENKRARSSSSSSTSSCFPSPSSTRMAITFLLNNDVETIRATQVTVPSQLASGSTSSTTSRSSSRSDSFCKGNDNERQRNMLSSCSDLLYFAVASHSRLRPLVAQNEIEETSSEVSAESPKSASANAANPRLSAVSLSPFQCNICLKIFKERGNMTKHRKSVHALSPRAFPCGLPGCKKSFAFRDGLNRHRATVHDCVRAYSCPVASCGKSFKQRSHAEKHVRSIHKMTVPLNLQRAEWYSPMWHIILCSSTNLSKLSFQLSNWTNLICALLNADVVESCTTFNLERLYLS